MAERRAKFSIPPPADPQAGVIPSTSHGIDAFAPRATTLQMASLAAVTGLSLIPTVHLAETPINVESGTVITVDNLQGNNITVDSSKVPTTDMNQDQYQKLVAAMDNWKAGQGFDSNGVAFFQIDAHHVVAAFEILGQDGQPLRDAGNNYIFSTYPVTESGSTIEVIETPTTNGGSTEALRITNGDKVSYMVVVDQMRQTDPAQTSFGTPTRNLVSFSSTSLSEATIQNILAHPEQTWVTRTIATSPDGQFIMNQDGTYQYETNLYVGLDHTPTQYDQPIYSGQGSVNDQTQENILIRETIVKVNYEAAPTITHQLHAVGAGENGDGGNYPMVVI